MSGSPLVLDWFPMVGLLQCINDFCKNEFAYEPVMSLALPYAHMPPIFTFITLPIEPDCTTATAMQCDPVLTSTCIQHYYRHSIIPVIGFRHNTQAHHFTAPFMPHMTLHYLFTYLASLSGCIQLDSLLIHSFSFIITTSPIHIPHSCTLTHVHVHTHTTPLLFSPLHPSIDTAPYPLIAPSEPHRAFVVI